MDLPIPEPITGPISGVIFDLDGTLTRPGAIDFGLMRRRLGMAESGSVLHWIERTTRDSTEAAEMHAIVDEVEREALARMEPAEHLAPLLDTLERRVAEGLHTGICTRNSSEALTAFDQLIRSLGAPPIERLFHARIARDHHSQTIGAPIQNKPSPEPAHECIRLWRASERFELVHQPEWEPPIHPELLFVGDDIDDCLCGRRAGFEAVLLEHGPPGQFFAGQPAARRRAAGLHEITRWLGPDA